ncbi:MAG: chromate transporter [Cyanobacteria bacterium SIG29]|nr:chromate transporter [Cyanobacteria bacterium SIG29]
MLKLYFLLYYEFLKIGAFAIGGGYAALPFLYYIQKQHQWFSIEELTNMIAVSNITPGPIGINMATYTGFTTAGILGSICATTAIMTIPFLIVIIIIKLFDKFKNLKEINDIFIGLRPAACALLTSIGLTLLYQTIKIENTIDYKALILFLILIIPFSFIKKNPLLIILAGALGGIIINSF